MLLTGFLVWIRLWLGTELQLLLDTGSIQEEGGIGTEGHGLVGMVVMCWRLDYMILVVFSSLTDSMILFSKSKLSKSEVGNGEQTCFTLLSLRILF